MAIALKDANILYGGTIPGFCDDEHKRLQWVCEMHDSRAFKAIPRSAWMTLPVSVVRRAQCIEAANHGTLFFDDDIDGLSVLLAHKADVWVLEPDAQRATWLRKQAQSHSVDARHRVVSNINEVPPCDAAVVATGVASVTALALNRAHALIAKKNPKQGMIYAQIRAPWEHQMLQDIKIAGYTINDHIREIDIYYVPGVFVVDSVGDFIALSCCNTQSSEQIQPLGATPADDLPLQPYKVIDFDALNPKQVALGLRPFVDAVADALGDGEASRMYFQEDLRQTVYWQAKNGSGFTAHLHLEECHLLVSVMPYHGALEYAVYCSAMSVLGDAYTRVRPQLTRYLHHVKISA